MAARRLLILGGTSEGRALADAASVRFGRDLAVVSALAGRTNAPRLPEGAVRIGGFGGTDGLASYLRAERIDLLVDATHPFATRISVQARDAAARVGVPRLILTRPSWRPAAGDRWIEVETLEEAATAIPAEARMVFLALGAQGLARFALAAVSPACPARGFLVRMVDPPREHVALPRYRLVLARGPFSETAERALFAEHGIDCLVARASGGEAAAAKLAAARALGLSVVMVRRPPPPEGERVSSLEAALAWVAQRLAEGTRR